MKTEVKPLILTRRLPKTGQTTSYVTGDDGQYQKGWGAGMPPRFLFRIIQGEYFTEDKATGLLWPQEVEADGWDNGNSHTFASAIAYAEALTYGGFSDWRLPNITELLSLVNHESVSPATSGTNIDFGLDARFEVWSGTTCKWNTALAWYFDSYYGEKKTYTKTNPRFLICVRDIK